MKEIVDKSGESSTGKRCDDEDPDMVKGSGFSGEDEIGEGGGDGTGRVDAGSGEVDADEVDKSQGETDDETGRFLDLGILAGDIEDDIDKDEGEDDLKKQGAKDSTHIEISTGSEIASGSGIDAIHSSHLQDAKENNGAEKSTHDLGHDIEDEFLECHSLGQKATQ